jgi:IclR family mhp operon transcriptional activator
MPEDKPYVEVRALTRGINLLLELNRLGSGRPSMLARATGIDRTTTYRLLTTLEKLNLVTQRPSDDAFVLAASVRNLSDGYNDRDHLTRCAALHLGGLFQQVLWPTDFATFDGTSMVIRETTHRFSPYSVHRGMVGRSRPLFASALGRAFLAGASQAQRAAVIEIARGADGEANKVPPPALLDATMARMLEDFALHGYASSTGETEAHISAIALPIRGPDGARGAINVVFFRSAMTTAEAAKRFLTPLQECIAKIEADMAHEDATGDGVAQPAPSDRV